MASRGREHNISEFPERSRTVAEQTPNRRLPKKTDSLREQFRELAAEWHEATDSLSSPMRIYMHPAYQRIIAKGPLVIPLILEDLRTRDGDWFYALELLNEDDASPAPPYSVGDTTRIKAAWLAWGRRKGYVH